MSLVKPPDPELLQNMSVKEQMAYMARHAQATLSRSSSVDGDNVCPQSTSGAADPASTEKPADARTPKGTVSIPKKTPAIYPMLALILQRGGQL